MMRTHISSYQLVRYRWGPVRWGTARKVAGGVFLLVLAVAGGVQGQQYASQRGHLLDANNRVGSLGINRSTTLNALRPRINNYITGNVTGGARFQGLVPYRSPYELSLGPVLGSGPGGLGIDTLSDFRRDSVGGSDLGRGMQIPRAYVAPSRSVTRSFGNRVVGTQNVGQLPVAPVGSAGRGRILPPVQFPGRPLSRPYSALRVGSRYSALDSGVDLGGVAGVHPWMFATSPVEAGQGERQTGQVPLGAQPAIEARATTGPQPGAGGTTGETGGETGGATGGAAGGATGGTEGGAVEGVAPAVTPTPFEQALADYAAERAGAEAGAASGSEQQGEAQQGAGGRGGGSKGGVEPMFSVPVGVPESAGAAQRFRWYLERGTALMREGKYYRAANAFETAGVFEPQNPVAGLAQACALFGAGEFMSAAFYLNKALTASGELASSGIKLKDLFPDDSVLQGRLDELTHWQERSGDPRLLFLKGYVLYQTGEREAAREAIKNALQAQPDSAAIRAVLQAIDKAGGGDTANQ